MNVDQYEARWKALISNQETTLRKIVNEHRAVEEEFSEEFSVIKAGLATRPIYQPNSSFLAAHALNSDPAIVAFYNVTDGLSIPFFDAAFGRIFSARNLVRLDADRDLADSAVPLIEDLVTDYVNESGYEFGRDGIQARNAILMTPYVNSGVYVALPTANCESVICAKCMFKGTSKVYPSFFALLEDDFRRHVANSLDAIAFLEEDI